MKYAVVFSAVAAVAAAAKPSFLNADFDVKEGVGFTLRFDNCQGGCTIVLQNGPASDTRDVKTLTTAATGDSFTFTAKDIATGVYNFKIISNTNSSAFNYSKQFPYSGTGTIGALKSGTSSLDSTSAPSSASPTTSRTKSATASPTTASVTSSSSASATSSPSNTSAEPSTSIESSAPAATTLPNAGGRASSPLALVAGAVAALAYLG